MSEHAHELLEEQIRQIGELRNASTRDPGFKQWRQATLTVIQRIWPTDATKSERFRRVPFSAPSSKMSRTLMRECYERGCAEAVSLLKSLIAEASPIGVHGPGHRRAELPEASSRAATPASEAPISDAPSFLPAREPVFDLTQPDAAADPPVTPWRGQKGFRIPMPLDDVPTADPDGRESSSGSAPPVPEPGHVTARLGRGSRKGSGKPALKDMLGFSDSAASPAASEPAPTVHLAPLPPPASPLLAPTVRESRLPPPASPLIARPPQSEPGHHAEMEDSETFDEPPAAARERDFPDDFEQASDVAAEFIRTSPVLGARPRPIQRAPRPAPSTAVTPVAAALAALAAEVAHLGVPDGQRAGARAALLDLGRQFDEETLTWKELRNAIAFVMEYPPLARRVVPMLIPYLELEL